MAYNPFDDIRSSVSSLSSTSYGIRASHISDVAINWSHLKLDNSELKEQIKRELIADLKTEGLIISKSPMKEMTEERMNRKIDQILENSSEKDKGE